MKDIYEILNDANLDFSDIEEMDIDELEKNRGKKKLMNSINKQKKSMKKQIVAASILAVAVVSIFAANPALAQNLPIIGDLIQRDLVKINPKYEDYINVIGKTCSYDGIDITFDNAVVDKSTLFLSFTVKGDNKISLNDLGDKVGYFMIKVNGEQVGIHGSGSSEQIDDNSFRVLQRLDLDYDELPEVMDVQIIDVKRNMDINFTVNTKDIEAQTTVNEVNKSINVNGKEYFVESISVSPLVTEIKYHIEHPGIIESNDWLLFDVINQDGIALKDSRSTTSGWGDYTYDARIDYDMKFISTENMESLKLVPKFKDEKYEDQAIIVDLK